MRNFEQLNRFYQPRRDMAQSLMQSGMSTAPVQHWTQGLGRIAQALVGAHLNKKLEAEMDEKLKKRQGKMSEMIKSLMTEKIGEDHDDTLQVGQQWGDSPVVMNEADVPSEAMNDENKILGSNKGSMVALNMPDTDERIPRDIMGLGKMGKTMLAYNEMFPGGMEDIAPIFNYQNTMEDRKYSSELAKQKRGYEVEDAATKFERDKVLRQLAPGRSPIPGVDTPFSNDVFKQKKTLADVNQSRLNPLQQKQLERLTPPKSGLVDRGGVTKSGIPIAESTPWAGQAENDAAPMRSKIYTDSSKSIEKYDAALKEQKILSSRLKRFKYLNSIQPTNEDFMGIPIDRITDFSFDKEKREMVSIVDAVTPLMRQGLPGAASERDTAMFRGATVGIGQDKATNDNIVTGITTSVKIAEDYQKFRKEYLATNKHLEGADVKWQEYLEANPIFDPKAPEGSYIINENRRGYKDYFRNPDRPEPAPRATENIPPPPGNYVLDPENR